MNNSHDLPVYFPTMSTTSSTHHPISVPIGQFAGGIPIQTSVGWWEPAVVVVVIVVIILVVIVVLCSSPDDPHRPGSFVYSVMYYHASTTFYYVYIGACFCFIMNCLYFVCFVFSVLHECRAQWRANHPSLRIMKRKFAKAKNPVQKDKKKSFKRKLWLCFKQYCLRIKPKEYRLPLRWRPKPLGKQKFDPIRVDIQQYQ